MDSGEVPVGGDLLRKLVQPRLRGLLCTTNEKEGADSHVDTDVLHMEGLPSLVPFSLKGAMYCSQICTPSATDMPADPPPDAQSGSSKPSMYRGAEVILLKAAKREASVSSALPPPQSMGTGIGAPVHVGLGDQSYHQPMWDSKIE
jgi:hypothetical protein